MLGERYDYNTNTEFFDYEFESEGPYGRIKKVARFDKIDEQLFNFGFGDLDPTTGDISDTAVSNNGDTKKILNTVASIIFFFTGIYQDSWIFIKGSTPARTRMYQMGISENWDQINPGFEIKGLKKGKWEPYRRGTNYEAFLGRRKTSFFVNNPSIG